ncbi:MAG: DNA repair protein RecN [Alistipes sp.]|nr:DNA repair protein RecN [Alistipes sp.]
MLKGLAIENYALIESLRVEWDEHLNIITGETGAGKSILLGALGLLLGAKNEGQALKESSRNCVVEASFDIDGLGLEALFEENDIDYEPQIEVRRIITPAGKSRAFIGDMPVQLSVLRELGAHLVDIHSQHQNMILQSEEFRIKALDILAENGTTLTQYTSSLAALNTLRSQYRELKGSLEEARKEEEWLRYTVEELRAANLKDGEKSEVEQQLSVAESADRINEILVGLRNALDNEEMGAIATLTRSQRELNALDGKYADGVTLATRIRSVVEELKDISATAADEQERIECDPEKLQKLSDRLNTIYSLEIKHRAESYDDLLAKREEYSQRLATIDNSDAELNALQSKMNECEAECRAIAGRLHDARAAICKDVERRMVDMLITLGIEDARFCVELKELDTLTATGYDSVAFLFSANKTSAPAPIERIASGGELSRVMLVLKVMLAEHMKLPTIIFDEIDTGVSGRIASAMGDIIAKLSARIQVIDITHLPQVAAKRGAHFVVFKEQGLSNIRRLTDKERIDEIAKMLSGSTITDAARKQAKILLE